MTTAELSVGVLHAMTEFTIKLKQIQLGDNNWGDDWGWSSLVQIMAWHLTGAKPLSEPMLTYYASHIKE